MDGHHGHPALAGALVAWLRGWIERLIDELSERARRDDLTGTLNRRALEERAGLELARIRRDQTELSLLALDIDRFKELNDRFGHSAGDNVLRGVAETVRRSTRAIDAVARLGGDEFVVLLPGAGANAAHGGRADPHGDSRRQRHRDPLGDRGQHRRRDRAHRGALDQLLHEADVAMYQGKRAGGDEVRVATRERGARTQRTTAAS